jgi:AcrR family transcriptional regulator
MPGMVVTLSAIVNTTCHDTRHVCYSERMVRVRPHRAKPFAKAVPAGSRNLRARKQDVVRDALASAALDLFLTGGFERTTVEQIARAAGVSRRTFFRYFESKEDVLAKHADTYGERLHAELAGRPLDEPPLAAIRNALVPAVEMALQDREVVRCTIRLLRETNSLRQVVMARNSRIEERVAALMTRRLKAKAADSTPMLLAFLTRALLDTAINTWYDRETEDVARLIDDLMAHLRVVVLAPAEPAHAAEHARPWVPPARG